MCGTIGDLKDNHGLGWVAIFIEGHIRAGGQIEVGGHQRIADTFTIDGFCTLDSVEQDLTGFVHHRAAEARAFASDFFKCSNEILR